MTKLEKNVEKNYSITSETLNYHLCTAIYIAIVELVRPFDHRI